jgi:formamidase
VQGVRIPTRPHPGTAVVAPGVTGRANGIPAGKHGGKIDNRRIGTDAAKYYSPREPAALFPVGAPHVSRGDGAISRTAIDASFEVHVRKDFLFSSPLPETPRHWIEHGFNEDLKVVPRDASLDMMTPRTSHRRLSPADGCCSVAAEFAVTRGEDGRQGIHCRIRRGPYRC